MTREQIRLALCCVCVGTLSESVVAASPRSSASPGGSASVGSVESVGSVGSVGSAKGVIAYLTSESADDLRMLKHSLRLLQTNLLARFEYPVIVFHDGLSEAEQSEIRAAGPQALWLEQIKLPGLPSCLNENDLQERINRAALHRASLIVQRSNGARDKSQIGYRYTNRWVHGLMGYERAFDPYDYVMRLDTDSFLINPVDVDPFKALAEGGHAVAIPHVCCQFACLEWHSSGVSNGSVSGLSMHTSQS